MNGSSSETTLQEDGSSEKKAREAAAATAALQEGDYHWRAPDAILGFFSFLILSWTAHHCSRFFYFFLIWTRLLETGVVHVLTHAQTSSYCPFCTVSDGMAVLGPNHLRLHLIKLVRISNIRISWDNQKKLSKSLKLADKLKKIIMFLGVIL